MARRKSEVLNDAPEMGNFEVEEVSLDEIQRETPKVVVSHNAP